MTFDANYLPHRDNLPTTIAAMMDRVFYANRAAGRNVQYVTETGVVDERSFNSRERAEAFASNLAKRGIASVLSA